MVRLLPELEEAARPRGYRDGRGRHRAGPGSVRVRDVGQRGQPDGTDRAVSGRHGHGQPVGGTGTRATGRGQRGVNNSAERSVVTRPGTGPTWTRRRRSAMTTPPGNRWWCAGPGRAGGSGRRRPPT